MNFFLKILNLGILLISINPGKASSCGIPSIKQPGRIINGDVAIPNYWSWVISIRHLSKSSTGVIRNHICGGSLISTEYVLTAAHCVEGLNQDAINIAIGSSFLDGKDQVFYELSGIHIHPGYYSDFKKNDVALLKLKNEISLSENLSVICLPDTSDISIIFDQEVVVVGWGSTNGENSRDKISNSLLQANMKIYNRYMPNICKNYESFVYCALDPSSRKSNICFGDSGGPLMFFSQDRWFLYGTSSFVTVHQSNFSCVNTDASYFVMIPNYVDWIRNIIKNEILTGTTKRTTTSIRKVSRSCGTRPQLKKIYSRIILGIEAMNNEWPWMVSIRNKTNKGYVHVCGGTLVSDRDVITAAHCVFTVREEDLIAVIGLNNLDAVLKPENKFLISKVIIHPNYIYRKTFHNIALIKLAKNTTINQKINPICLPNDKLTDVIHNKNVVVTGWGNTERSRSGTLSNSLRQTTLQILNNLPDNDCKDLDDYFYCALSETKDSNICFGDAGGPLMYKLNDKWYLYGTSSFTSITNVTLECMPSRPSYYIKIPNYNEWLTANMNF